MRNPYCKFHHWEVTKELCEVAQFKAPADLAIINAKLVNVCTCEIQENTVILITHGRIAAVLDGEKFSSKVEAEKIVDAGGKFVAPSFIDGHIHIESSMMSAGEFARCVVAHGTSAVFWDPHEIANVLGVEGIKLALQDTKRTPLKAYITTPSCVPSVPGLEDGATIITSSQIEDTYKDDEFVALGEMMNYPGILACDDECHKKVACTLEKDRVANGHWATSNVDEELNAYVASGISSCHESTKPDEVHAKMRLGCYAQMRYGSAFQDMPNLLPAVIKHNIDTRFASIVTDDAHPETLHKEGHLDRTLKKAVACGLDPLKAIQMVTINVAQSFDLAHEIGSIAPGKCADIVILDNLDNFKVEKTIIDGDVVAENGKPLFSLPKFEYPSFATKSIHIKEEIKLSDFDIKCPFSESGKAKVKAVHASPASSITDVFEGYVNVEEGKAKSNVEDDILKFCVFERHKKTGMIGKGFVHGFKIKCGALASTVAHDSHNLSVMGTNDQDMLVAANAILDSSGGLVAVANGEILAHIPLSIAGLMGDKRCEEMSELAESLAHAWKKMGCDLPSPFIAMGFVPLPCIPHLRISNRGVVDVDNFCITSPFVIDD